MNITGLSGRTNGVKLYVNDHTDWDFRIWLFAVLTGFFCNEMYERFAGTKKVAVITR